MADVGNVYNPTTQPDQGSKKWFAIPSEHLDIIRFGIKFAEVVLSFLAFVLEEVVAGCTSCTPLYFFEFVSCTAFLFTTLLLVLLSTVLYKKVGINRWPTVDFVYTGVILFFFGIAAIVFACVNGGTSVEKAAVAFGFLATIAFAVDLGYFGMTKGLPFVKKSSQPTGDLEQPEAEKLRANGAE
ncbi:CKLF-like MARVEL transmembrane domain-containing protein 6 [Conger conger]|nr:CKLF-like MARVEL transmembrane domain-containing protein 6 [Conger conger]